MHKRLTLFAALLAALLVVSLPAGAAVPTDSAQLRAAVTAENITMHLKAFQSIADKNGGNRAAGTSGYQASVDYVVKKLKQAGYQPTRQTFEFPFFAETGPQEFERLTPTFRDYVRGTDFDIMQYSGAGDVTANVVATNDIVIPPGATAGTSNSGCEAADFPASTADNVALIQRGTCTFEEKANNAKAAGALAAIIFNEGQEGRTDIINGTLGNPQTIPVLDTTFAVGEELYTLTKSGSVSVHILTSTLSETRTAENVIAETAGGRADRVVVVGAHLDSVFAGPGMNDDGTGSAAILEVARQMAKLGVQPANKVRFAWWGAEELGLFGSAAYVSRLSARDIKNIALNLNFDMLGSPNYVRFVYDGDGGGDPEAAGPPGSAQIEAIFNRYFASQGLATEPTPFDGRSDYGPFIAVGIPAGGLFSGAEGVKTEEQADLFGGTAGVAYDECYHQACDDIDNVNTDAVNELGDAAAHAVATLAKTRSGWFPDGSLRVHHRATAEVRQARSIHPRR